MSVVHLTPDQLSAVLAGHAAKLPKAIDDGLFMAAHRGRTLLVKRSPVDQGQYKNSWEVRRLGAGNGAAIENNAPHAGIIEGGARPHPVNREGIDALTAWVLRHLTTSSGKIRSQGSAVYGPKQQRAPVYGPKQAPMYGPPKSASIGARDIARAKRAANLQDAEKQARGIAFAIAAKLKKEGQKGLFLVRDAMPQLSKFMQQEVARQLNKALGGK